LGYALSKNNIYKNTNKLPTIATIATIATGRV